MSDKEGVVEWGIASLASEGGEHLGDLGLVAGFPGGALVAAVDGLGHGKEAAVAAEGAAGVLEAEPGAPPETLVRRCHERLTRTRGVALSLASIDARRDRMAWLGVGNVDCVLMPRSSRARERIVMLGGVVGYRLPPLRARRLDLSPGDLLVLATDGVHGDFAGTVDKTGKAQAVADAVLARCATGRDDALVLAVRYLGERS